MNIAIVIGVSKYFSSSENHEIIAPKEDALRINKLLKATGKYKNILCITDETVATKVKNNIRSFLQSYEKEEIEIEEVFYYFSGHGKYVDQKFYMLCSDFTDKKLGMTSLENSEIDDFIRLLNPKLTVKVIDACFSGYRYIKDIQDNSSEYTDNNSLQNTLGNVIFMASSHDDQKSQMMGKDSFFTTKFIEAALSADVGTTVLYRDIQAFISDEFRSMNTQIPYFINQWKGIEVFSEYSEEMQQLKKEFYLENDKDIKFEDSYYKKNDAIQVEEKEVREKNMLENLQQVLAKKDLLFVEKSDITTTLENIKNHLLNYPINDEIVSAFYQLNFDWHLKLSDIAKSSEILTMADIEDWQKEYLITIVKKPIGNTAPKSSFLAPFLASFSRFNEYPVSLHASNSLPYEVINIEFQPIDKLSLSPFFVIIALVHSQTHVLTLLSRGIMIKSGWQQFAVDWDSLRWNKKKFRWKDIIENPNLLWKDVLDESIEELKQYLIKLV
ncbi:caspase family protein [Anabaena lutea]|uniref:Caspase family protein n=1 Tax=Anabaena lutea FACHB-196 TaxID=2692881 RepID=A0ABR8FHK6_9NOST|nr:caspase family protein [Anabaena lutea]MBD2569264.1 caspase family protein [Anabaena lutea FACHB-196]